MLNVKEVCAQKGITLQALSKKIGITYQSLYESINGNPSLNRLNEIADALGVDVADLFRSNTNTMVCPKCGAVIDLHPEERV